MKPAERDRMLALAEEWARQSHRCCIESEPEYHGLEYADELRALLAGMEGEDGTQ